MYLSYRQYIYTYNRAFTMTRSICLQITIVVLFTLVIVGLGVYNNNSIIKNCYETLPNVTLDLTITPDFPKKDEAMLWTVMALVICLSLYAIFISGVFISKAVKCKCRGSAVDSACKIGRVRCCLVLAALNIPVAVVTSLLEIVAALIVYSDCKPQEVTIYEVAFFLDDQQQSSALMISALCLTVLTALFTTIVQYNIDKLFQSPEDVNKINANEIEMKKMPLL